jgi:hypothetical protein
VANTGKQRKITLEEWNEMIDYQEEIGSFNACPNWRAIRGVSFFRLTPKPSL